MAHFAQINEENIVTQVIVVDNQILLDPGTDIENEQNGVNYCKQIFGENTNWIQTSYNAKFRKNYAGIGFYYNRELDAFIPPKPLDSINNETYWELNTDTCTWTLIQTISSE